MDLEFNKNDDKMRLLISQMEQRLSKIHLGGGKSRIDKLHEQGKMSARERIDFLLDKDCSRVEIGAFAGYEMYAEHGGCPAGGVVVMIGYVSGKQCIVVANDATVKAGAWFPITGKKNLRAQEIAMENRLPIIYLVDSAGVYLPMQDEIFPDKEHFGRIFRNNAVMSSMGILQIAAVMGSCVAGGAYLPIMSDEAMIVDKTGSIFLAGVLVALVVGAVVVYMVLSNDVGNHLAEYATLKAMGYSGSYLARVVLGAALILAVGGFIPGVILSYFLYGVVGGATFLPLRLDLPLALRFSAKDASVVCG
jgi:acetyl-CoA carboxylase carboxyltransferase component